MVHAQENKIIEGEQTVQGVVVDHLSRKSLDQVAVGLYGDGQLIEQQFIDAGESFVFTFEYEPEEDYTLVAKKKEFLTESIDLTSALKEGGVPDLLEVSLGEEDMSFVFKGQILDRDTREPIEGAEVKVVNTHTGEITRQQSDYGGNYAIKVKSGYEYDVEVHEREFLKRYTYINYCKDTLSKYQKYCLRGFSGPTLDDKGGITAATVLLDKAEIGKRFTVNNIYYDYNKATLRKDALPNLYKLYHILNDNPQLIVELGSHADSRGSDQYNLKLSQKRAESAVNYVVTQGIESERISAKGYGESKLINHCQNDVKCSDREHEVNRRTEFVITDLDYSALGE